jgi:hypothetical protein
VSEEAIRASFPELKEGDWEITSPQDSTYNCVACALGETGRFWWPGLWGIAYWPHDAPDEETVESFRIAFEAAGFLVCADGGLEADDEKIAIFAKGGRRPASPAA